MDGENLRRICIQKKSDNSTLSTIIYILWKNRNEISGKKWNDDNYNSKENSTLYKV